MERFKGMNKTEDRKSFDCARDDYYLHNGLSRFGWTTKDLYFNGPTSCYFVKLIRDGLMKVFLDD